MLTYLLIKVIHVPFYIRFRTSRDFKLLLFNVRGLKHAMPYSNRWHVSRSPQPSAVRAEPSYHLYSLVSLPTARPILLCCRCYMLSMVICCMSIYIYGHFVPRHVTNQKWALVQCLHFIYLGNGAKICFQRQTAYTISRSSWRRVPIFLPRFPRMIR